MGSFLKNPYSFGMAYDFIDCIGDDVDVVSDSEVGSAFPYLSNLFLKYGYGQNLFFLFSAEH